MKYEEFLQEFAELSDSEAGVVLASVHIDARYRLEIAGLVVANVAFIAAVSLTVPALYRAFHPSSFFVNIVAIAAIVGIACLAIVLRLLIHRSYWQAVARHLTVAKSEP